MYRMSRIRASGIGPADARYDRPSPDAPPFEISCLGPDGKPDDTVVWLENGGGKTVLLALVFHVLRPDKAPQIGNDERGRRGDISNFVLPGDVGHIVIEWVADDTDELLITGLVVDRKGAATNRNWYLLSVRDGAVSLDNLAFDSDGHRVPANRYLESLEQLASKAGKAGRRNRVELVKTNVQRTWLETLANNQLDPALFEYQVRMNRSEGGATSLFRFASSEKFIEFFLELTMKPETVDLLSETLRRVADKVASLPRKELELAHATGVIDRLARLQAAWAAFQEADEARAAAQRRVDHLYDRVSAAVAKAKDDVDAAEQVVEAVAERQREADRRRRDTEARARALAIVAADARIEEHKAKVVALEATSKDLALTAAAWPRIGLRLDRDRLTGLVEELARAMDAANNEAAPLRERRDTLRRAVRAQLERLRDQAVAEMDAADLARRDADTAETAAAEARRSAEGRIREIVGRASELSKQVARHEADVARAVADGDLTVGADPQVALGEAEAAVTSLDDQLAELREQRQDLIGQLPGLRRAAEDAADHARRATTDAEQLAASVAAATEERHRLAAAPLLAELGGADADLELVGSLLTASVAEEAVRLRAEAVAAAAASAEDRRAADTLERDHLLPARAVVDTLCSTLAAGGVLSAVPGWRYIVEALPSSDHARVIAAHPAVADGIVVAVADLDRARDLLADVAPAAAVLIAPGTFLTDATVDGPTGWVVPPAPAMHDQSQAEDELGRRHELLEVAAESQAALTAGEQAARDLLARLSAHMDTWPQGVLPTEAIRRDELADVAQAATAAAKAARDEVTTVESWLGELSLQYDEQQCRQQTAQRRVDRLRRLAADSVEVFAARQQVTALAAERVIEAERVLQAEAGWTKARHDRDVAVDDRHAAKQARDANVRLLGDVPDPGAGPVAEDAPLEELRARLAQATRAVAEATTDSELAQQLAQMNEQRRRVDLEWSALEANLRERVAQLAAATSAADADSRRTAEASATDASAAAVRAVADAQAQLDIDTTNRTRLLSPERPAELGDLPTDAESLERLARQAEAGATEARLLRAATDDQLKQANLVSDRARDTVKAREGQLTVMLSSVGDRDPLEAQAFDGDPANAVRATMVAVAETTKRREATNAQWTKMAMAVGTFARQAQWAELTGDLPRRLRNDDPEQLASAAADLLTQTKVLAARLRDDIDQLDTHRKLLMTSLADAVTEAHRSLKRARSKSILPSGLGDWSGQPFLKIGLEVPSDATELDARLRRFTNEVLERASVSGGTLITGAPLVTQAVLACAEKAVTVDVLKPNKAQTLRYNSITDMAALSGGMRATAAIAMFCTLARVRATNRTGRAGVGTLILDNPIGDANAPYLVALQRLVARMSGVQLLYTTGVNDMDALRLFPVMTRLTNEVAKRSHLAYVTADEAFLKRLAPAAAGDGAVITGTRLVRRQPPLLIVDATAGPDDDL